MSKIKLYQSFNNLIHKAGLDIRRYPLRQQRILLAYLQQNNVNYCFDIGANTGQFALDFIKAGFKETIFSFEPQTEAFSILSKNTLKYKKWKAFNSALGNTDGQAIINISANSVSSSILHIEELHIQAAPQSKYIGQEKIPIKKLDTFVNEIGLEDKFFLKIDAQGYECKILEGADECFQKIYALQLEIACAELYKGEKLFDEMKAYIESRGFYISSIESGFTDPQTGCLLQAEVIFLKNV